MVNAKLFRCGYLSVSRRRDSRYIRVGATSLTLVLGGWCKVIIRMWTLTHEGSAQMAEVEVKERKACKIAYIEHLGDYGSIPYEKYISQLYSWAKEKKVMPGFLPMGIFYDNPSKVPPEKCRGEIAIQIMGDAKPDKNVKVRELPSMKVAVFKHKAPAEDYPESYRKLSAWITQNGYEWVGPAIEVYTKKPKVVGGETILYTHIQAPVKKK